MGNLGKRSLSDKQNLASDPDTLTEALTALAQDEIKLLFLNKH